MFYVASAKYVYVFIFCVSLVWLEVDTCMTVSSYWHRCSRLKFNIFWCTVSSLLLHITLINHSWHGRFWLWLSFLTVINIKVWLVIYLLILEISATTQKYHSSSTHCTKHMAKWWIWSSFFQLWQYHFLWLLVQYFDGFHFVYSHRNPYPTRNRNKFMIFCIIKQHFSLCWSLSKHVTFTKKWWWVILLLFIFTL